MEKRVFLIVLDSFGIGAEPDAAAFGDEGTNTLGATTDTLYSANVQDDAGNTLNVKWTIYGNQLGHVYGKFDEATNTFTVPMRQYFGDGQPIDLGDEQSPIVFFGVSTNDYFCDFVYPVR